jgi:spore coat protein U-like protein
MSRRALFLFVLFTGLAASERASAMTCSVSAVTGVAFGAYDIFDPLPVDSVGAVTYLCDGVLAADLISIELSSGNASSAFGRYLAQGAYRLDYNLYLDPARAIVWGDGAGGTSRYQQVTPADGVPTTVPVYGRIPAGQNAHVGTYADTIIATVIF